jgi:hypothetical protein
MCKYLYFLLSFLRTFSKGVPFRGLTCLILFLFMGQCEEVFDFIFPPHELIVSQSLIIAILSILQILRKYAEIFTIFKFPACVKVTSDN